MVLRLEYRPGTAGLVGIVAISILVLHRTAVLTVAIAAFIVMVMKGPADVADVDPFEDSESPDSSHGR